MGRVEEDEGCTHEIRGSGSAKDKGRNLEVRGSRSVLEDSSKTSSSLENSNSNRENSDEDKQVLSMDKKDILSEENLRRSERVTNLPKHFKDFIVHTARHKTPPPSTFSPRTPQFMLEPRQDHWDAAMRVLRYLKQSPGQGIFLRPTSLELEAFCDSDWASYPLTRFSITGYFIMLGGCPVSWKMKKQTTVSRSSAEAEYRAMVATVSEVIWLRSLLPSLGVQLTAPTRLLCDNQDALYITTNPVFHGRTKHIEIDRHFIREHLKSGVVATDYLPTRLQLADIFTKALGRDRFRFLLSKLDIRDLHAPT
ncbi:hypothetical protein CRG98_020753 [Punica granatum]|uniref:Reverse transcriptase Ty1/copia-type domain-containing protein n=1 Tax=Punica granatum TaxID=22663 RepID=A0A2I0JRD9_PUNGR|nr:hypothetical protein CRG98_020753 [Punica granatum]